MAIDPRIALGVQPLQIQQQDPAAGMNALARMMQINSSMQEADLGRLKMQELQRGVERRNKLDTIVSQKYARPEDLEAAVLQGGFIEEHGKLAKDRREAMNSDATRQKTELETALKKTEHMASMLSLASPQNWSTVRSVVKAQLGQDLPEQFDPQWVQASLAGGQTLSERLKSEHDRLTRTETGRHNLATEANTVRGQDVAASTARRGQDMVDARSRESNAQGKTQIVETPQGFVIVDKNTGQSRPATGADGQPLKGKANDRVMTDAQAKANLFGTRMREADRILSELTGKYSPMAVNAKMAAQELPVVGGAFGAMGNLTASAEGQQAEQAQRDFINAVLRRESGAVISPQEFANAKQQYFPQPNDKPANIAQKARNRALAISGLEAEVPGGFRVSPSLTSPGGNPGGATGDFSTSPDVDALLKKYGGK